ncbi:MAG: phosphopentomutase, partial [Kiritimatiellae bacterium]|nr:phosphopentomutase [Kiritimatiellia bacterium]
MVDFGLFKGRDSGIICDMRAFLIILDSVGIGEAPDAEAYGDKGANTLAHLASAAGGLNVPTMTAMGLGNICDIIPNGRPIAGVPAVKAPSACFGAMQEVSKGKDTTTGHWEIAGLELSDGFHVFPAKSPSFPEKLIKQFEKKTGRTIIGNLAASGTEIIKRLGARQREDGCWIVYTSADSVMQIAAHEDVIPLEELYKACEIARKLCDTYRVGRVIARPYIGEPGNFVRTENRRDYSYPLPEPTILDKLTDRNISVTTVGKLDDIFNNQGISRSFHVENNKDAESIVLDIVQEDSNGLVFVNLIDFDMLYGHRRDSEGYARALESTDVFLGNLIKKLRKDDLLMITADHGNDPTFKGT